MKIISNAEAKKGPVEAEEVVAGGALDRYLLQVTNSSDKATHEGEIVTITDALPPGLVPVAAAAKLSSETSEENIACTLGHVVRCTYGGVVPAGEVIVVAIKVAAVDTESAVVTNSSTVEGGGPGFTKVSTSEPVTAPNTINGSEPSFGIQDFSLSALNAGGAPDLQAASHPYSLTTSFDFDSVLLPEATPTGASSVSLREPAVTTPQAVKSVITYLPLGLDGDPLATTRCPEDKLESQQCPAASILGTRSLIFEGEVGEVFSPVYNVMPESGYPAQMGINVFNYGVELYDSVVPTREGYRLRVATPSVSKAYAFTGLALTVFGDPAEHDGGEGLPNAFLTNPTACSVNPQSARIEANSWEEPKNWVSAESVVDLQVTGCDMLQFNPMITVAPETTQVATPSGYEVDVKVPQAPNVGPVLATPDLKDARVALPEGVSVSPSAADGLVGCQESGPEGIELGNKDTLGPEVQEGEELGPDGLPRASRGHCPVASRIGEIGVATPVLPGPLHGHVYLAEPKCGGQGQAPCTEASATNGELYALYLEAEGSGVIIKLKGTVSADPATGQLTTTFNENPQLPFSELKLRLNGGERAPLANPQSCGSFVTTSDLTPWSTPTTPDASPFSSFSITGCNNPMPFAPSFAAGTVSPNAGAFSPFTLTFSRNDGEENLSGLTVHTPPGLLGKIAEVSLCEEPQAREGACSQASRIGTTTVAAGAGSHPFWLSGTVYLTKGYEGAPFGLSIVVPEHAGPFNLGNEVVRAAINVDPHTSALTVTSDPLPQTKDGVPFRLRTINVTIDRPNFIINPTNCETQHVTGTIAGVLPSGAPGASVPVSTPFAVAGCKGLPFKPKFTVLTEAKTSKAKGAYLHVKVTSGPGQANIGKVKVDLPKQLPSRLTTLQKACTAATFNANPAACPAASVVGEGTAVTPILKHPLKGPAYLVSHGGAAFPDLEIVLQGEEITLDLDGQTDIKKGITSSTFRSVPDAPITAFDLVLTEGPHSALTAAGNLCDTTLVMPTVLTGQNGAVIKQATKIMTTGCPKTKKLSHKPRKKVKTSDRRSK